MSHRNPFLDPTFEIRWVRLQPSFIEPAITQAIETARDELTRIKEQDRSDLTFEGTFLAFERALEPFSVAWGKVCHLDSVSNTPAIREAHNKMIPVVTAFSTGIYLDTKLWEILKTFAESPAGQALEGVEARYRDETLASFREAGANLPPDRKKRLEEVESELALATQKFSENVLDATNAFELIVDDEARLKGLPPSQCDAALEDAKKKGHATEDAPKWRFTLHMPSYLPAMKFLEDGNLRRQLWEGFSAVGRKEPHDNTALIWKILKLRKEKAEILDKANFADLVLERRMARNGEKALQFVEDLHSRIKTAFDAENAELEAYRAEKTGEDAGSLEPWEVAYWSERLRKEQFDLDEEALRPYFPVDSVIDGMFQIAQRLFSVTFKERPTMFRKPGGETPRFPGTLPPWAWPVEVWSGDVRYYEVRNEDTELIGAFYADWHPRETKRGGAWMNYLYTGLPAEANGGWREPHLGLICGNMTPPGKDHPALLTHDEVLTVFHEFGHLMHHLLGNVAIKTLNGVNVAWDFVELPSQIMENWCWENEGLEVISSHFENESPLPRDLFEKMLRARNFQTARGTMRQLELGKLDLELHINLEKWLAAADEEGECPDFDKVADTILSGYRMPTQTWSPTIARRFTHIFGSSTGYAAGYYSYKWAEVLDADAFTKFQESGVMDPLTGLDFRDKLLSKGNSEPPEALFRNFMGRDPDLQALLDREGLNAK